MADSLERGRVELRVRWDGGAKGRKSRRVPITPKLAAAIKRYEVREQRSGRCTALLINERGEAYQRFGVDAMMDRLQRRVATGSTPTLSGTRSRPSLHSWAGTLSDCERQWATPTTPYCSATSGWRPSAT